MWANDFTRPPCAIDGWFPKIFAVRDLASQRQLLWLPVDRTIDALHVLFAEHGASLVLKCDNGSPSGCGT